MITRITAKYARIWRKYGLLSWWSYAPAEIADDGDGHLSRACSALLAAVDKTVLTRKERALTDDECALLRAHASRIRVAAQWLESAANHGHLGIDGTLTKLLRDKDA